MRVSIKLKLSFLIFMLVVVLMGVTGLLILRQVERAFLAELKLRGTLLANNTAFAAVDPLVANEDRDLPLTQLVTDATKQPGVVYAFIIDENGLLAPTLVRRGSQEKPDVDTVLWHKPSSAAEEKIKPLKTYEVVTPVTLANGRVIGEVHIGFDLHSLRATINRIQLIVLAITVIGIFFGILGSFLLASFMVRPVKALVKGVQAIGQGDFEQRIRLRSRDEIGELTDAFNAMAKSLREKELIKDAFRRYVSPKVTSEIFKDPDRYHHALKGEKRKVAVLFADIRGFTPMTERLPAEEVVQLLNSYFTTATQVIFRYSGTVDKFMGDCLMAIFGAPIPEERFAVNAVRAALAIQDELQKLNIERTREKKEPIWVGIGINSGEVVVGNIGSEERLDYTAVGDVVNFAQRLQELARGGEIAVSESVFTETAGEFLVSALEPLTVKGKKEPVRPYLIKGILPGSTPGTASRP
jgi:class 3 adenylate cyclase